jgi:hypothetical protein
MDGVTYTPIAEVQCDFYPIPKEEVEFYRHKLTHIWGYESQHADYFPGATPVSLDRSMLKDLDPDDYLASLKADGTRNILMMTMSPMGEHKAILIDRKMSMYEAPVWAREDFFRLGSIVDGEMTTAPNQRNHAFLVFDLMVVAGQDKTHLRYEERVGEISTLFGVRGDISAEELEQEVIERNRVVAAPDSGFVMTPKPTVSLSNNLWGLWERRNSTGFQSDGVVLTRRDYQVTEGTAKEILKWKPTHTVDVIVTREGGMVIGVPPHTFEADKSCLVFENASWKCVLEKNVVTDAMEEQAANVVMECRCDLDTDARVIRFTPLQVRRDKKFGNGIHTVKMTLMNVMEALGIDEVISVCAENLRKKSNALRCKRPRAER